MKIYIYNKKFVKESKDVQKAIINGIESLYTRIKTYEEQNIDFMHIFNDERVKYDKHGQFYTFKCFRSDMQLRLLYSYLIIDEEPIIVIADFFIKKKNNKEYISKFDFANNLNPYDIYHKSQFLCAV